MLEEDLSCDVDGVNVYITDKPCSTCTVPLDMASNCEDFCGTFQEWLDKQ